MRARIVGRSVALGRSCQHEEMFAEGYRYRADQEAGRGAAPLAAASCGRPSALKSKVLAKSVSTPRGTARRRCIRLQVKRSLRGSSPMIWASRFRFTTLKVDILAKPTTSPRVRYKSVPSEIMALNMVRCQGGPTEIFFPVLSSDAAAFLHSQLGTRSGRCRRRKSMRDMHYPNRQNANMTYGLDKADLCRTRCQLAGRAVLQPEIRRGRRGSVKCSTGWRYPGQLGPNTLVHWWRNWLVTGLISGIIADCR